MPDTIHLIPLAEIDATALTRDRTALDPEALIELRHSIAAHGLRLPIEIYELADPDGPRRYGLISGLRRLTAFRALHEGLPEKYATIPAILREPDSLAAALTAMVEENEVRADISPWERGLVVCNAVDRGLFPTIEEAVNALYLSADRKKRARIRTFARVVEDLDGTLTNPHTLGTRQILRLAAACRKDGFLDLIRTALTQSSSRDAATQWQILLPILTEAESPEAEPYDPPRPAARAER